MSRDIKKVRKWKEWCDDCKKYHIVWLQPCPDCGFYETPQPSEGVKENCKGKFRNHYKFRCDGCDAYQDHLR